MVADQVGSNPTGQSQRVGPGQTLGIGGSGLSDPSPMIVAWFSIAHVAGARACYLTTTYAC